MMWRKQTCNPISPVLSCPHIASWSPPTTCPICEVYDEAKREEEEKAKTTRHDNSKLAFFSRGKVFRVVKVYLRRRRERERENSRFPDRRGVESNASEDEDEDEDWREG